MATSEIAAEYHIPVLIHEVLDGLNIQKGQWYVDGTVGGGGHAAMIVTAGGKVLGIDQDDQAIAQAHLQLEKLGKPGNDYRLIKGNFRDIAEIVEQQAIGQVAGVLLDLGVSSHQLDSDERGFSFTSATLDMRMDADQPIMAADLVARLAEADLVKLFTDLGEERFARPLAKAIVQARAQQPIVSGQQLADIIYAASPAVYRHGPIHPATRIFQALRLAVNDEIGSLEQALPSAWSVIKDGGRLAVISFHSLEDRPVKQFMRQLAAQGHAQLLTTRPQTATINELRDNPRSRSAKLRVAEKMN